MIDVRNMTKKYGKLVANDNINLSVGRGELAVLLGPNGAGKSTLIKSVCGLLRFQGAVTINGHENHTVEAKRLLGYVPEFPVLYPMLTVGEHLEFIAKAYRLEAWEEKGEALLGHLALVILIAYRVIPIFCLRPLCLKYTMIIKRVNTIRSRTIF